MLGLSSSIVQNGWCWVLDGLNAGGSNAAGNWRTDVMDAIAYSNLGMACKYTRAGTAKQ